MLISTTQLSESNSAQTVIVDCRFSLADPAAGQKAYRQGHIPGAVYANLDRDLSSAITQQSGRHPLPDLSRFLQQLGQWGIGRDTHVVVYDDMSGAIAGRLWWLLKWLNHENVSLLDGGWNLWQKEQRPISVESPQPTLVHYTSNADDRLWLSSTAVSRGLASGDLSLLDARAEARFRGEEEPIDPVAGHVPGAINRPMQHNLDQNGCFLTAEDLKQQFTQLLGDTDPASVAHMCGSGVTACHNLFAMELAGLKGSKLYPGSWSEWIRDPEREIACGA